jgi:hypothetical protein
MMGGESPLSYLNSMFVRDFDISVPYLQFGDNIAKVEKDLMFSTFPCILLVVLKTFNQVAYNRMALFIIRSGL